MNTINWPGDQVAQDEVRIVDVTGRVVYALRTSTNALGIMELPAGMYRLMLLRNGVLLHTAGFMKADF